MVPQPTKAESLRAIADFRDYADDVLRSDHATIAGNLRQLVKLMRRSALFDRLFATELRPAQYDSWLHAMTSSRQLLWPDDLREKLFLQNRLVCAVADNELNVLKFAHAVFSVRSGEDAVGKFLDQIFHPFARECLKLAQEMADQLAAKSLATPTSAAVAPEPTMDIFISHSSNDEELAGALAVFFQLGLGLDRKRIRCTSVNGFRLPAGANVSERLKVEVHDARVLVGLITPASVQSSYVLFELGARWGLTKFIAPLLAKGAPASLLPGPISGINALRADNDEQMHQFLGDLAAHLGLPAPDPAGYTKHLKEVVRIASVVSAAPATASVASVSAGEQNILRILWDLEDGCSFAELASKAKLSRPDAEFYANELERRGWVHIPIDFDEEVDVTITQDGRRHLKSRGLV